MPRSLPHWYSLTNNIDVQETHFSSPTYYSVDTKTIDKAPETLTDQDSNQQSPGYETTQSRQSRFGSLQNIIRFYGHRPEGIVRFESQTRRGSNLSSRAQDRSYVRPSSYDFEIMMESEEKKIKVSPLGQGTFTAVQGQLCSVFENGSFSCLGSGTISLHETQDSYFLITCAHNFVQPVECEGVVESEWDFYVKHPNQTDYELHNQLGISSQRECIQTYQKPKCKLRYCDASVYRYSQDGAKNFALESKISQIAIPTDYFKNPGLFSGNDIAVCLLESHFDFSYLPRSQNSCWMHIEHLNLLQGEEIYIVGYPAEGGGYLFMMRGKIKSLQQVGRGRTLILYDDLDLSGGMNGAPVYVKRSHVYARVGIHLGYDSSKKTHAALAITKEIYNWIIETHKRLREK